MVDEKYSYGFDDCRQEGREEFLPQRRGLYNEVHERMFGAPMAAIENYFPLKRLKNDLHHEQDVNGASNEQPASSWSISKAWRTGALEIGG